MLPVHHDIQLEVILPISTSTSSDIDVSKTASVHPMITRSKSGVLPQMSYKGYLAALPELQYLQLTSDEYFGEGFSFLANSIDASEPTTFGKAASMPRWWNAMQEEYNSLRDQSLVTHGCINSKTILMDLYPGIKLGWWHKVFHKNKELIT